jgi:hypothetical protein
VKVPARGAQQAFCRPLMEALLALSAPLLVLVALLVLSQRQGQERIQALPALAIGTGLAVTSQVRRRHRRRALLQALHQSPPSPGPS